MFLPLFCLVLLFMPIVLAMVWVILRKPDPDTDAASTELLLPSTALRSFNRQLSRNEFLEDGAVVA